MFAFKTVYDSIMEEVGGSTAETRTVLPRDRFPAARFECALATALTEPESMSVRVMCYTRSENTCHDGLVCLL
jgi:hypothetical protein